MFRVSKAVQAPINCFVKLYRVLRPNKQPMCRFYPTCSEYALDAIKGHGVFRGLMLSLRRILRCHPFGGSGIDFVPGVELQNNLD